MAYEFPILLVDDDPNIVDILRNAARTHFPQATFLYVSTFAEAVNYLENLKGRGPKLVLLDINLKTHGEGLEFLSLLRKHPQGRLLPVVVLSASQSPDQIREAYELGAATFTSKPYSYSEWKAYLAQLKTYWLDTVSLPGIWFEKDE